ncbi:GNAT family N-acetyltransferase [Limnofasciculus baicalensis]|uniref:GNAT family N-acetyltransferase n=1 Tax=Limnofasciculus baicalensis BBK-W-15 TaxID=2699891 RepID=A0AAE3GNU0_9CYAN|nr:GNAT family N-acetyltransferase [Limnofasciculus baicalensis]MCP2727991.1 GNAT family N-acetyltransferase [Limnofasciculus baicalensis BBK-W-15]
MLTLHQATGHQLSALLEQPARSEIDGFLLPKSEEVAPRFWVEFVNDQLRQYPENSFWWSPRSIVVDSLAETLRERLMVGMIGFKSPPDSNGSVEIGYGIVPSQQGHGFATQAVDLLVKEAFSKAEIQTIVAYTVPMNSASGRVLEKNQFVRDGSKIDPEDGEVWVWRRMR